MVKDPPQHHFHMQKQDIHNTITYLNSIEKQIDIYDEIKLNINMTKLHQVIEELMDEIYATTDQDLKVFLSTLELRARKYLGLIRDKLAVFN